MECCAQDVGYGVCCFETLAVVEGHLSDAKYPSKGGTKTISALEHSILCNLEPLRSREVRLVCVEPEN